MAPGSQRSYSLAPGIKVGSNADREVLHPEIKKMLAGMSSERRDVLAGTVEAFKQLREKARDRRDIWQLDCVLRELGFLQKILRGEILLFNSEGNLFVPGDVSAIWFERYFGADGILVPKAGWQVTDSVLGARVWEPPDSPNVKLRIVTSGMWTGALAVEGARAVTEEGSEAGEYILLPGARFFESLNP